MNAQDCPCCGNELEIKANHEYIIKQNGEGRWHKGEGSVIYTCTSCGSNLAPNEIEEALKQTDEL